MNENDDKVTNDDDEDDDESIWTELLEELTKKHGNIPKYLYRAISESPESSTTSTSCSSEPPYPHSEQTDERSREEQAGDGLSSPEVQRRSPGVDSGCSVGFNDDDYDDENDEETRRETSIKTLLKDLHAIRETTVSLAKQFINAFDIIEDMKYMNETTSSRESLSSSVSGSQEILSSNQRQRRYNLRKFSRSVPNARGACPELISRHHRKRSEDIRLRIFEENMPQELNMDTKAASTKENINKTAVRLSPRRASDDSSAMSPKKIEIVHRRSSSLSSGEKKDQWMQNMLDFDEQHRSVPSFADLLRAQNDEIGNYFNFEVLPNKDNILHVESGPAIDLDDISVQVDKVLESELPHVDRIDLDTISDKYDIHNDDNGQQNDRVEIDTISDEKYDGIHNSNTSQHNIAIEGDVASEEASQPNKGICDDKYDIPNSEISKQNDGKTNDSISDDKYDIPNSEISKQNDHGKTNDSIISDDKNDNKKDEDSTGTQLVYRQDEYPTNNMTSQSPPYSPSLVNGESPRKSWLHGEVRYSYNERIEMAANSETVTRVRSRSLTLTETKAWDEDNTEKQEQGDQSQSTQPKKKSKKLQRSPTYHGTKRQLKRSPPPNKEDASLFSPISPRYYQLLLMLEQGEATDL